MFFPIFVCFMMFAAIFFTIAFLFMCFTMVRAIIPFCASPVVCTNTVVAAFMVAAAANACAAVMAAPMPVRHNRHSQPAQQREGCRHYNKAFFTLLEEFHFCYLLVSSICFYLTYRIRFSVRNPCNKMKKI